MSAAIVSLEGRIKGGEEFNSFEQNKMICRYTRLGGVRGVCLVFDNVTRSGSLIVLSLMGSSDGADNNA